jgi:hypothetical protein
MPDFIASQPRRKDNLAAQTKPALINYVSAIFA